MDLPAERPQLGSSAVPGRRGWSNVWIDRSSPRPLARRPGCLALWLAAEGASSADGPVAVVPARRALERQRLGMPRIRPHAQLGFSVLAIDYRGFGKSQRPACPPEDMAYEDARVPGIWLARAPPAASATSSAIPLGGAIGIDLAAGRRTNSGVIVERHLHLHSRRRQPSMKWGWLPVGPLITQRFEPAKIELKAPLLVVHGTEDPLIQHPRPPCTKPHRPQALLLVDGGTHYGQHHIIGQAQYRQALAQFFSLK